MIAVLSEGLAGDLRPLSYSRSTWDVPFLGRPLLVQALEWLERRGCAEIVLVDETPGQWLLSLPRSTSIPVRTVDARANTATLAGLDGHRIYHLKPCALIDPEIEALEAFHETSESAATFALTRLEPGQLSWPFIPACRMDEFGCILEVDKLRRTDALGSANLDNVLGASAPTRPREFWAPRNVSIIEPEVASSLPLSEWVAPLAGLARKLAADGVACYGCAMRGRWWPVSSTAELMKANREALLVRMIAPDAQIGDGAKIERSIVGPRAEIGPGARVRDSILDADTRVGARSEVTESLLGAGTALPDDIHVHGAVVGSGEAQNLMRGVPPGGYFLDGLRSVDEAAILAYWDDHVPLVGRARHATIERTLNKGLDNNVYHIADEGRHRVLKRRLDCNAHPLLREFHVLRLLDGSRLAPRPLLVDVRPEVRVAPCLVMEYIEGRIIPPGGITPSLAASIGRTCRAVHALAVDKMLADLPELASDAFPDLLSYVTDLAMQYNSYLDSRPLTDALGENLGHLVKSMQEMAERENVHWSKPVPRVLCQGDLREFNMLIRDDDGQVALLDWERCGVDDAAYDIGWFLALSRLTAPAEAAFRDSYGTPDDRFWARVDAFRMADVLSWPVHLLALVDAFRQQPTSSGTSYENDAYQALAEAFNTAAALARSLTGGGNGLSGGYTADGIREMGPLFV